MNDPTPPNPDAPRARLNRLGGAVAALCRGLIESLPGQLLMLTVGLIAIGVVLVYFPASAAYRLQWMMGRAAAAHLAALWARMRSGHCWRALTRSPCRVCAMA